MNSFREIAEKMDSVHPAKSLSELIEMHRWSITEEKSFDAIVKRHSQENTISFLLLNSYLMELVFGNDDVEVAIRILSFLGGGLIGGLTNTIYESTELDESEKPFIDERSKAIGDTIKESFDLALLNEVFEDSIKDKILNSWDVNKKPLVAEDSEYYTNDSSGLMTVIDNNKNGIIKNINNFKNRTFHKYSFSEGTDSYAEKGCLLVEIDVGLGDSNLEVYNTHINAAKDDNVRIKQLIELVAFFKKENNSNNIAVIAGDFNINSFDKEKVFFSTEIVNGIDEDAARFLDKKLAQSYTNGMSEYDVLRELLEWIGFQDIWETRNQGYGYTTYFQTYDWDGVSGEPVCKPDENNVELCKDDDLTKYNSKRIDYIFIQKPQDNHSFNIDITRPRRFRGSPEKYGLKYLSDHLGLTTNLILSKKNSYNR